MRYQDIKRFIEDYEFRLKYRRSSPFFPAILGNIFKSFRLIKKRNRDYDEEVYYFNLDDEDLQYLYNKYKPIYEKLTKEAKETELFNLTLEAKRLEEKAKKLREEVENKK